MGRRAAPARPPLLTANNVTMQTKAVRIVKRKTQGRFAMGLGSHLRCGG